MPATDPDPAYSPEPVHLPADAETSAVSGEHRDEHWDEHRDEHRHTEDEALPDEPVEMTREEFEDAVGDALDQVPAQLMSLLDNVVFFVEDEPPADDPELLGVYDGIPLTERDESWGGQMPDRITIFRGPTLRMCEDRDEVIEEIAITVVHEIAHHFGIDDEKLHALGWG